MHLLLTGYRGCGKTTIGGLVARSLQFRLIDTDLEVEAQSGCSIAEIFENSGESTFRDLESDQIHKLEAITEPCVISLGGGAILRPENRERIRTLGRTVWLQASPEIIFERISKDANTATRRPKLSKLGELEEIRSLLLQRSCLYAEVAGMQISTEELSMEAVAMRIVEWYRTGS
jgi:shikimate kinase